MSQQVEIERRADGFFVASVTYWSADHRIGIGVTSAGGVHHHGRGDDQYIIEQVDVEIIPAEPVDEESRVNFVDVGARGGFSHSMQLQGAIVRPILFEPDPSGAIGLREACSAYPGSQVHEYALFNTNGPRRLYLTRERGCSSLLPPNVEFIRPYPNSAWFDVIEEVEVECVRYDELFRRGEAPTADAIKIDVQGAEYHVLEGFGGLLQQCLGIELECHTYPLYHGERLVSDLTNLLAPFGLMLHRLHRVNHYFEEWVEFDAWFLRPGRLRSSLTDSEIAKLEVIKRAWGL